MNELYMKRIKNKLKVTWDVSEKLPEDQKAYARMSIVDDTIDKLAAEDNTEWNKAFEIFEKNNEEAEAKIIEGNKLITDAQKLSEDNYKKAYDQIMKL